MRVPIGDVMRRNVICAFEDFDVETLEELLLERGLSGVPVVDNDGKLVGFVAMTDVVRDLHARSAPGEAAATGTLAWGFHEELEPRTAGQLMTPIAFELQKSWPVARAVDLMATQHVHRVPVVSGDGKLVGIVTAGDVMQYLARMRWAASEAPGGPEPAEAAGAGPDPERSVERERLTEADRLVALGFLAGGVAHQINNALTSIRLSLGRLTSFELSRRPISEARLHRIELLQDVREGVARVEQVIRELKAFSHMEDGPARAVDVSAQLEVAIGLAAHEIRHRARLVCDYARLPQVRARPGELRQVLLNLLVNAAQAIPEGEAHVNEIRVVTRTDVQGRASIEITDSGSGIPSGVLDRIFDPFFTTRRDGQGLGLGLTVARDLVSAMGGEIAIESIVGKGTTVRVTLPPCEEPAAAVRAADPPRPDHRERSKPQRILIIDDDRPVAAAIALELIDHDVVVAESGREALQILRRDKSFDVILCDLMMPEVSGMDVYDSLRLVDPTLLDRVVLMTGGAFTARAGQFLSDVGAPMLEKPFRPEQLHAIVNALDHRRELVEASQPEPEDGPWRPSDPSQGKG